MKILFLLIGLSMSLFAIALWAFFWMVRHRQFEDLDSAGWRVLLDDPPKEPPPE